MLDVTTKNQPTDLSALDEAQFRAAFEQAIKAIDAPLDAAPISIDWLGSPVGPLLIGATPTAIVLLEFSSPDEVAAQLVRMRKRLDKPLVHEATPLLNSLRSQLAEYFSGTRRAFDLPFASLGGSPE